MHYLDSLKAINNGQAAVQLALGYIVLQHMVQIAGSVLGVTILHFPLH